MVDAGPFARDRWAARTGVASLLPYASVKTYWACGGTAGKPPGLDLAAEFERNGAPQPLVWLERHGVDFTAVLAVLGAALLLALVRAGAGAGAGAGARTTGRSRRLLLATAWCGAALLTPYGLLTAWAALGGHHPTGGPGFSGWIVAAGVIAFCGTGGALAVCAGSYQLRVRRSRAAPPDAGGSRGLTPDCAGTGGRRQPLTRFGRSG